MSTAGRMGCWGMAGFSVQVHLGLLGCLVLLHVFWGFNVVVCVAVKGWHYCCWSCLGLVGSWWWLCWLGLQYGAVMMASSMTKGLVGCFVSVGDAFRGCAIEVKWICWLIEGPGSLSSSSDSASDVLSSSEVFSSSSSMKTYTSDPSVSYSSSCGILAPRVYILASLSHWTSVHSFTYCMHPFSSTATQSLSTSQVHLRTAHACPERPGVEWFVIFWRSAPISCLVRRDRFQVGYRGGHQGSRCLLHGGCRGRITGRGH